MKNDTRRRKTSALRKKAEEELESKPKSSRKSAAEKESLLHELQVHQIELEMQNDELRQTRAALEDSHKRITDLYDFAPVGYLSINEEGRIVEANLTTSSLLGYEKRTLIGIPFTGLVYRDDQDIFYKYLRSLRSGPLQTCEIRLTMKSSGIFYAQLIGVPFRGDAKAAKEFLISVFDISARKQMEMALQQSENRLKIMNENLEDMVIQRTKQVHDLSKALTVAEQRERQRFSQILHEGLQQTLFSAKMQIDTIDCGSPAGSAESAEDIAMVKKLLRKAITTTKSLAVELNPPILKNEGLDAALQWISRHMKERYGLVACIDVSKDLNTIKDIDQILVIQLTRELLYNIIKHAGTKEVVITGKKVGKSIEIIVEDKGVGFNVDEIRKRDIHKSGMGLFSIEERLRLFWWKI